MLVNKTLDALTPSSRSLYESAVVKLVLSIVYGAFAVMFLGFCAEVGGFATSYQSKDLFRCMKYLRNKQYDSLKVVDLFY